MAQLRAKRQPRHPRKFGHLSPSTSSIGTVVTAYHIFLFLCSALPAPNTDQILSCHSFGLWSKLSRAGPEPGPRQPSGQINQADYIAKAILPPYNEEPPASPLYPFFVLPCATFDDDARKNLNSEVLEQGTRVAADWRSSHGSPCTSFFVPVLVPVPSTFDQLRECR